MVIRLGSRTLHAFLAIAITAGATSYARQSTHPRLLQGLGASGTGLTVVQSTGGLGAGVSISSTVTTFGSGPHIVINKTNPDGTTVETGRIRAVAPRVRIVHIIGRLVFAASESQYAIIDIGDLDRPVISGHGEIASPPIASTAINNTVFIVLGGGGFMKCSIERASMLECVIYNEEKEYSDVAISGDHLLLAGGARGLIAIDLVDPLATERLVYARPIYLLATHDRSLLLAYYVSGGVGIEVFDIESDLALTRVHGETTNSSGTCHDLDISSRLAAISCDNVGVMTLNLDKARQGLAIGFQIVAPYVANNLSVNAANITLIMDSGLVTATGANDHWSEISHSRFVGRAVALAEGDGGWFTVDATGDVLFYESRDGSALDDIAVMTGMTKTTGISVRGNIAATSVFDKAAARYGIAFHALQGITPVASHFYRLDTNPIDLFVGADFVVASDSNAEIRTWSIDGTSLVVEATMPTDMPVFDLEVVEQRAYVARGDLGVSVLDISTPRQPRLLRRLGDLGRAADISISADMMFVASGDNGIGIANIGDIANSSTSVSPVISSTSRVLIIGDTLHVAARRPRLTSWDVSKPESPSLIGAIDPGCPVTDLQPFGNNILVASGGCGLFVIGVSDIGSTTPTMGPTAKSATTTPSPELTETQTPDAPISTLTATPGKVPIQSIYLPNLLRQRGS